MYRYTHKQRSRLRLLLSISFAITLIWGSWKVWHRKTKTAQAYHLDSSKLKNISNLIPVAIIGSGPAGLSAALYSSRAHIYTVVFQGPTAGGQLMGTTLVENWPAIGKKMGPNIMKDLESQARQFGTIIANETIEKVNLATWPFELWTTSGTKVHALTVILATGSSPRKLGIPGEEHFWGTGVTACAICDAPFFKDREAVIVGGGDSAAEEALQIAAYANKVTILARGETMRAAPSMQERLKQNAKINILYGVQVKEIFGQKDVVTGVILEKSDRSTENFKTDGVFLAIGHIPNTYLVKDFLSCDEMGSIKLTSRSQATSIPGVYAAGDVADHTYMQAGVASGDGIKAALDATRFIGEQGFNENIAHQVAINYYNPTTSIKKISLHKINSIEDFETSVLRSELPVIVDFYTQYCPSCKSMLPDLEALAAHFENKITIVKVDGGELQQLMHRYEISSVPCLLVIQHGILIARHLGALPKRELIDFAQHFIKEEAV